MYTIALIGQKGGTGKTTVATTLSVAAGRAGLATVLIDLDPQANASNWKDRRQHDDGPAVIAIPPSRLPHTLQTAQDNGADMAVIDAPGKQDSTAIDAARAADLVLIPTRPQIFELETLAAIRNLLRVAGDPKAYVLLNGLHPQAKKAAEEAKAMIQPNFGFPACPVHLCQRRSYGEAPTTGSVAEEIDPESAAAEECRQLYSWIRQQMKHSGKANGSNQKNLSVRKRT
jgi:chromosome partitioning protein